MHEGRLHVKIEGDYQWIEPEDAARMMSRSFPFVRSFYRDIDEFNRFLDNPTQGDFETKVDDFYKKAKHIKEYVGLYKDIWRALFPDTEYPCGSCSIFIIILLREVLGLKYYSSHKDVIRYYTSSMKDDTKKYLKEARKLYYKLKSLDSSLYLFMYHLVK